MHGLLSLNTQFGVNVETVLYSFESSFCPCYICSVLPGSFFFLTSSLYCWVGQRRDSTRQPLQFMCAGTMAKVHPGHGPGAAGVGWHHHSTQLWLLLLYMPLPCLTCSQRCKAIECPQLYISFCLNCVIPSVWSAWKV